MAADRAVLGVVEWLLICEAQVTGVRTRTLPIEVLVYLFTASGDAASQKAMASLLEPTGGGFASVLPSAIDLPSNIKLTYTAFSQAAQKEEYSEWRDWWYQEYLPKVLSEGLVEPVTFTKVMALRFSKGLAKPLLPERVLTCKGRGAEFCCFLLSSENA